MCHGQCSQPLDQRSLSLSKQLHFGLLLVVLAVAVDIVDIAEVASAAGTVADIVVGIAAVAAAVVASVVGTVAGTVVAAPESSAFAAPLLACRTRALYSQPWF